MRALLMTPKKKGYQPGANTLVYYNINDNDTNSTIYDLSGNNVNQNYTNASYSIDTTYDRVANINSSSYSRANNIVNFGNNFTWIVLFKPNNRSGGAIISECSSSSIWAVELRTNWDNIAYYGIMAGSGNDPHDNGLGAGTLSTIPLDWTMVAVTVDSNKNAKIYVNGVKENEKTLPNLPNFGGNGNPLSIGREHDYISVSDLQFKFFIGEDRVWTDAEIAALAQEYGFTVN